MTLNLLVVDDSSVMRRIILRSLKEAGITIGEFLEASNGYEGLSHLVDKKIDVVLCDLNMPEMDGLEFIQRVKELSLPQPVPIILITALATDRRVHEGLNCGARDYILKPFTPEALLEKIKSVLAEPR